MKKQTAVEWLVEQIDPNLLVTEKVRLAVQQAKAMEKGQIINAYKADCETLGNDDTFNNEAEQYYNEIFKSE